MALCAALLAAQPATSQSLFDRGKDLLKGFGGGNSGGTMSGLSSGEIAKGLKEALRVGSDAWWARWDAPTDLTDRPMSISRCLSP
tara:strand:+ start:242 stop:496 length:255 start_codon:yes stop_codon:yes gene_type:complete